MQKEKEPIGHLLALITILIWGTTFISTKVLLRVISPIEILFLRFVIGFVILFLIYPRRLKVKEKKQELYFVAAGLCGVTLYYLLENIALTYTFASNVGVIICIAPFFTAIFAHLFLEGEKLSFSFFGGFMIAAIGVFLISFNGSTQLQLNPLGDILAILASIVWAAYSVFTKKISSFGYNMIQSTRKIFLYGLLCMIPALFIFEFKPSFEVLLEPVYLFNMLFLGLGASALCFVTWNLAVKIVGAINTSLYIYLVPVITVATSIIVLHEKMTGMAIAGTLLTLVGLFVSERRGKMTNTIIAKQN
ncbi:drug/metabolite transporter (DMT)-like permease [Paenibacillus turicensis]|uniref:Drug/metabolite transporter (DMT)-like permease n=1 Tax=Paenibacillus turicensis TaxID=160487 RepID=A0ABS4FT33_9BACL|nr:DMT family transporter [Paenibacillus turicensis]MBP1905741.1 drug/metabolite transporter (DMT)-like permease [Paenibacillus turicensis]